MAMGALVDLDNQHAAGRPGPARQREGSLGARWPWTHMHSRQRCVCLTRGLWCHARPTHAAPDQARTLLTGHPARLACAMGGAQRRDDAENMRACLLLCTSVHPLSRQAFVAH